MPATSDVYAMGTRVLVVDDQASARKLLTALLKKEGYNCAEAPDADHAMTALESDDFDVVVTDMNMPGKSGIDLIRWITDRHPDIASIMLTGTDDSELAALAMKLGAYGYLVKPSKPNEILIAVANAVHRRSLEIENRKHRSTLEDMVKSRTEQLWQSLSQLEQSEVELRRSREETVTRLAIVAELRDNETGLHVQRMSRYCGLLAERAGEDSERCEMIRIASQLHDVGKIATPDQILLKKGPLSAAEHAVMEKHAAAGHRILAGSGSALLDVGAMIALTHHERMDGSGYPRALSGRDIPFEGRVAAIADVFDALTNNRPYRNAFSVLDAVGMMRSGSGSQFDPRLLDVFFGSLDAVVAVKEELDAGEERETSRAPSTPAAQS